MANHGGDQPPLSSGNLELLRNLFAELVCETENHDEISPAPSLTASSTGTASPTRSASPSGSDSPVRTPGRDLPTEEEDQRHRRYVMSFSGSLWKKYDDEGYNQVFGEQFTNFPEHPCFNCRYLPQPDFIEGLVMKEYLPVPVDEIPFAVLYEDDPSSLVLPHISGEWKREGYDMKRAELRSAYHGAALVYARSQALSYIGEPDPDGHSSIVTFTTDGHHINFFTHHASSSDDGRVEYHMYPLVTENLTTSREDFGRALTTLYNLRDHARELSYDLRDRLKEHWERRGGLP